MTCRCEFGNGNCWFARLAKGTVSGSNPMAVAAQMRLCGPQRERTQCSTVRSGWEGRASRLMRRLTRCHLHEPTCDGIASPVSRRWHAEKAMEGNLGDRMVSSVPMSPFCGVGLVAWPISLAGERAGDAPCGVGWAHSIHEVRDSITLMKRRGPTCGRGCSEPMEGAIALTG